MRLQGLTVGYRCLQGVTAVRKGYMGLQRVTGRLQGIKKGYMELQRVTEV